MNEECQDFDPKELLQEILKGATPTILKTRLIEGLKEELRVKLKQLLEVDRRLRLLKEENLSTCMTYRSYFSEEYDLWDHIDSLEEQIVEARQTKIYLNNNLYDLEEELLYIQSIRESKKKYNEYLKEMLKKKRKRLEVNKSWSHETVKISKSIEGAAAYWRDSIKHFWN